MSLLSAQFIFYLAFCLATILLLPAQWPGNEYCILRTSLLGSCVEMFCHISWQTQIWSSIALNTHAVQQNSSLKPCCTALNVGFRNALTDADKHRTYDITECYCCIHVAGQGWLAAASQSNRRWSSLHLHMWLVCSLIKTEKYYFTRYIITLRWVFVVNKLNNVIKFFSRCWGKDHSQEFFRGSVMSQYYLHILKRYISNC